jgi:hypothetical protein
MGYMVVCDIRATCELLQARSIQPITDVYCDRFNLVASACTQDPQMSTMSGCSAYNSLCAAGSVVKQCADAKGIPEVVGSFEVGSNFNFSIQNALNFNV